MMVRWYHPWLERLCGPAGSTSQESVDEYTHEIKVVEQLEPDVGSEKLESLQQIAEKIVRDFDFSDDDVRRAVGGFVDQMNEGLRDHGCTIEQLPSFITKVPTGYEKGTYLAIDMGGTNVRICSVTLNGNGTYALNQDKLAIPVDVMTAKTSTELFGWVAGAVQIFLQKHYPELLASRTTSQSEGRSPLNLGFTFSHAVQQLDIDSGTLIRWSKGFDIDGVVGQDICALLQNALNELALPVRVTALINDTVGTLLARAYTSPGSAQTILGAVFGTGTNGAYIEQASKITKLDRSQPDNASIMIVNSEWGNFDQKLQYLPTTTYDIAIDVESVNPGFEMFEKRISGMYLGEILRLVLLSLLESPTLKFFAGVAVPKTSRLYLQWGLDSSFMSYLENDNSPGLSISKTKIEEWLGIQRLSLEVVEAIRTISHAIGRRSARLSAVAIGAVLLQTNCLLGEDRIDIGVDGSLIELYPGYTAEIRRALKCVEQIGEKCEARTDITIAKDGSGVGAALAAYIAANTLKC